MEGEQEGWAGSRGLRRRGWDGRRLQGSINLGTVACCRTRVHCGRCKALNRPSDRRPVAARDAPQVVWLAGWLVRRQASPNGLSVAGMICGIAAGLAMSLVQRQPAAARPLWVLGAVLVQLRLLANLLDGMVAIGRNIASPLGELFNEVPDRVSDTAVLLGVGVACGHWGLGLAASLAAMSTAYVRNVGKASGAPSDFSGPMAKQQRMAVITALALWNAFAPSHWGAGSGLTALILCAITILAVGTALRRLRRVARSLQRQQSS